MSNTPTDEEIRSHIGETVGYYFWHNSNGSPPENEPMRKGKLLGSLQELMGEETEDSVWMVQSYSSKMRVSVEADNLYFNVEKDNIVHLDERDLLFQIKNRED